MIIDESNAKRAVGTVSPKSDLQDPHIRKLIDYLSKTTNQSVQDIEAHLMDKVQEMAGLQKKAPILYASMAHNAIEAELNKLFEKAPQPKAAPTFDPITFSALIRRVKAENASIFPLRNFIDRKPIASPRIILTPSKDPIDEKRFGSIHTAAATPDGEFIFYVPFMQQCLNFAHIKGVTPKSKKYKNNGGDFAPEWSIIEFLILHEFFHYTHADFHYQKVLKADPQIINWVGDFRSNYDLIKAGHEPIPMGLYNDLINYDRQKTYKEMYDLVKSEFDKLNPKEKDQVEKQLGDLGDDHSQGGDGDDEGEEGEGQEGEGQDGEGQEGEGKGKPGEGKGKGKPGEGKAKKPGRGDPEEATEDELEEHGKRVSGKAGKKDDNAAGGKEGDSGKGTGSGPGGRGASGPSSPTAVDWSGLRPRFDWKTLLAKLVKGSDTVETTYQKVHRRNITSVHVATQTGAGVVRPGEKEVPANLVKLCIVVDSSGSMASAIAMVLASVNKLLQEGGVAKSFVFVEFSSDYHMYLCTISGKSGTAREISDPNDVKSGGGGKVDTIASILGRHAGGGTNFTDDLAGKLAQFAAQKYNILILTDSDIASGGNKETFLELYAKFRQQVYLILDSRNTFVAMAKTMKGASANITHL
jgi:predicted metal-dependent peptidase